MARTAAQRRRKRERERQRLGRRRAEQLEARRNARITVWFPPASGLDPIDEAILEVQRELLKEGDE